MSRHCGQSALSTGYPSPLSRPLTRRAFLGGFLGALAGSLFFPHSLSAASQNVKRGLSLPNPSGPVLVLAPHPDDETLGSGARWHTLLAEGRDVHVVVLTSGDGFFVDAKAVFQTFRPNAHTYRALGERRMAESEHATFVLGLSPNRLSFLGLPDGGTASLFLENWDRLYFDPHTATDRAPYPNVRFPKLPYRGRDELRALRAILAEVKPATLIVPHPYDRHPDHWATHAFALAALESLRVQGVHLPKSQVTFLYLIHWPGWPIPTGYSPQSPLLPPEAFETAPTVWYPWPLSEELEELKHRAILAYETQLLVMPGKLLSFVRRDELLGVDAPAFVDLWRGRWGEVPTTIAEPEPSSLSFFLFPSPPPARLQVAHDDANLLVHVFGRHPIRAQDRVDLVFTLIHASFPDGVLRLSVTGLGDRLSAAVEGEGAESGGRFKHFKDGSVVVSFPLAWLRGAQSFLLGGSIVPEGLPPERLPFRLFRPLPPRHTFVL